MIPLEHLDTAQVPGGDELRLMRRGADFMIVLDRNELMNSRMSGSEEALATMTCERLGNRPKPHLLIGGYGMGFTLRAALRALGSDARLTVAELVPEIIAWARGPMAELAAGCLDDPRVAVVETDVAKLIAAARGTYDAILLDVDNGPDGLVREANDQLYSMAGLAAAKAALRPGGVLAVWSAAPDPVFAQRLKKAGFSVDEVVVRARSNGKGARHVIWFAAALPLRSGSLRQAGLPDPARKGVDEGAEEGLGVFHRDPALIVEQGEPAADIGFRLLQHGHVEEDQRLAQVMVGAEAADRARRDAHHRRRLLRPDAAAVGAGADVDGVLQDAGYRAVVFGRDEQNGVGRGDRFAEPGPGLRRAGRFEVFVVMGQITDFDDIEFEVSGCQPRQLERCLAVDRVLAQAADDHGDLVRL